MKKLARRPPDVGLTATVLRDRVVQRLHEAEKALVVAVTIPQHKLISDVAAAQDVFATDNRVGSTSSLDQKRCPM